MPQLIALALQIENALGGRDRQQARSLDRRFHSADRHRTFHRIVVAQIQGDLPCIGYAILPDDVGTVKDSLARLASSATPLSATTSIGWSPGICICTLLCSSSRLSAASYLAPSA